MNSELCIRVRYYDDMQTLNVCRTIMRFKVWVNKENVQMYKHIQMVLFFHHITRIRGLNICRGDIQLQMPSPGTDKKSTLRFPQTSSCSPFQTPKNGPPGSPKTTIALDWGYAKHHLHAVHKPPIALQNAPHSLNITDLILSPAPTKHIVMVKLPQSPNPGSGAFDTYYACGHG